MEAFKDIPGHEPYMASDRGQIRRVNGKILKPQKAGSGYLKVRIKGRQCYVHRLIALTFIGEIPEGFEVNHLDFNKHNNAPENLEICTPSENQKHAARPEWFRTQSRLSIFTY
jgi:hypothetical protein